MRATAEADAKELPGQTVAGRLCCFLVYQTMTIHEPVRSYSSRREPPLESGG